MSLLKRNLENAKGSLLQLIDDLQFLRDQVTITEVSLKIAILENIARTGGAVVAS